MGRVKGRLLVNTANGGVYYLDLKTAKAATRVGSMGMGRVASGDLGEKKVLSSVKNRNGVEELVELELKSGKSKLIAPFQDPKGKPISHAFGSSLFLRSCLGALRVFLKWTRALFGTKGCSWP